MMPLPGPEAFVGAEGVPDLGRPLGGGPLPGAEGWVGRSVVRPTAEFLVVLMTGLLLARTFAAEAYIVPTGSMAPTLLGMHRAYTCSNCRFRFALGTDEEGRAGRPVCPNCGQLEWSEAPWVEGSGDRLLVHKYLYDLRDPQRWEAAVFQNPTDPNQAYVKRIVGLPGEAVEIRGGDVYIDGRIARKTLEQQRALRLLIYDNDYTPADSDRYPRWVFRADGPRRWGGPSGWQTEGPRLVHRAEDGAAGRADWAQYRHWQPDGNKYGPVRDFVAYNGLELPGEHRVEDLAITFRAAADREAESLRVRLVRGGDRFTVAIPIGRGGGPEVRRNGRVVPVGVAGGADVFRASTARDPVVHRVEASLVDRRLTVAVDGELVFEPLDYEDPIPGLGPNQGPAAIGVDGPGWAELSEIRLYRDVYYTDALATAPRRPFGVGEPYRLGPGEYFVLGDNSPVSNDSRFWPDSPVVRRSLFVGKPFLVHLPSQAVPLQVFGHELYWIPDPREIRYIR